MEGKGATILHIARHYCNLLALAGFAPPEGRSPRPWQEHTHTKNLWMKEEKVGLNRCPSSLGTPTKRIFSTTHAHAQKPGSWLPFPSKRNLPPHLPSTHLLPLLHLLCFILPLSKKKQHTSANMSEGTYEGAIGIDLGMSFFSHPPPPAELPRRD